MGAEEVTKLSLDMSTDSKLAILLLIYSLIQLAQLQRKDSYVRIV